MKYLHIFETYKSQKELESLANLCIKKLAKETYDWNKDFIWTEPRKGDYLTMEEKWYRVKFKEENGFTQNALYLIHNINDSFVTFKGIPKKFKLEDVELTWSERNKYRFEKFIRTTVEDAARGDISRGTPYEFDELKDFIENTNIIYEAVNRNNDGVRGNLSRTIKYSDSMKRQVFVEDTLNELSKLKKEKSDDFGEFDDVEIYTHIFRKFFSTTLHELQHAYDNYRSKGKSFNKQTPEYRDKLNKSSELKDKRELKDEEREFMKKLSHQYLNFPHEINARFTQTIKDIAFSDLVNNDEGGWRFKMNSLRNVIIKFKSSFNGWNILSDKDKKRLIRKLSQFWHLEKERLDSKNKSKNSKAVTK